MLSRQTEGLIHVVNAASFHHLSHQKYKNKTARMQNMQEALHGGVGIQVRALMLRGWRNTTMSVLMRPLRSSTSWTPFFSVVCVSVPRHRWLGILLRAAVSISDLQMPHPLSLTTSRLSHVLFMACLEYHGYNPTTQAGDRAAPVFYAYPMRLKQSTTAYHDLELNF